MESYEIDDKLLDYLLSNVKDMTESDICEKKKQFPFTRSFNEFIKKLKSEYNIDFDKALISDSLLEKMIDEILFCLPK